MRLHRYVLPFLAASFAASVGGDAQAVGTRTFTLDTLDKLSGGDLKGVSVGSDGSVRAGYLLGNTTLPDANAVFAALPLADGSTLVATGPNGKVIKVQGEQATVFCDTGALAVTSLVQAANGAIYAGTIPDGKIFKISQGKADVFAQIPETNHIWALVLDKQRTGLFAGTGADGKIFRVEPNGTTSVYFKSEDPNVVSLALADNGDLFAGTSGKGIVYRLTGPGRGTVFHQFKEQQEVKSLLVHKDGSLYVIANEHAELPEPPRRSPAAGRVQTGPSSGPRPKPGKGVLMRFDASGKPEKMMSHSEFHYSALAFDEKGRPVVGTGAEGRVYTVDDKHVVTLLADAEERQIGAVVVVGGKPAVIAGDPAVFHKVLSQGGADAVWTSKVQDAGLRARFGHLGWKADGTIEISTRTGNTSAPDGTWSAWSNPMTAPGAIQGGAARFIQVRARWAKDPAAVLSEVTIPFVTDNLRPLVLDVNASQKGVLNRDSKDLLPASGGETPKHDTAVKISWKVENPDNDPLRYRLAFKKEGSNVWRDVLRDGESLTKTDYDWDTQSLSEGRYRVRVEASDELANSPAETLKHNRESDPFVIDHTAPVIATLQLAARKLRVRVTDSASPIVRVEIAIDGRSDFRPLVPADGIYDTQDESFDADVSSLVPAGSHLVTVRAYDAAGNVTTREADAN
jgi:hypothetical protein